MPDSSFDVTRFENRNGVISWRASGWLHGLRVRKNFKSCEEAATEMAALEAAAGGSALRTPPVRVSMYCSRRTLAAAPSRVPSVALYSSDTILPCGIPLGRPIFSGWPRRAPRSATRCIPCPRWGTPSDTMRDLSRDPGDRYAHLPAEEKERIREILRETHPEGRTRWGGK